MRVRLVSCVLALGVSFGLAGTALAQKDGPPRMSAAVILPADSGAQLYDLARRLQNLEQKLSWRTDDTAKQQLAQVRALRDIVLGTIPPTEVEFNRIASEIARLEFALS